jgi:hypothetical protein
VGFAANRTYAVKIPGVPALKVIRNGNSPMRHTFSTTFTTSGRYTDPIPGPPRFVEVGFDPPRHAANGLIDDDADIVLGFNEPIAIETLVPGTTVIVRRGAEQIAGEIRRHNSSERYFRFVPTHGLDLDASRRLSIQLTTDITDLAGNRLERPVSL